jgi:hypothetical protein
MNPFHGVASARLPDIKQNAHLSHHNKKVPFSSTQTKYGRLKPILLYIIRKNKV